MTSQTWGFFSWNVKINADSLIFCKPTLFVVEVDFYLFFLTGKNTVKSFSPIL